LRPAAASETKKDITLNLFFYNMVTPEFLQFALVFALTPNSVLGKIDVLKEATIKTPGPEVLVTVALLTFLKEDEGPPAHIFSGPITGYVLEGEFLFQVKPNFICLDNNKTQLILLKCRLSFLVTKENNFGSYVF